MAAVGLEARVQRPLTAAARAVMVMASGVASFAPARAIPLYIIGDDILPVMSQRRIVARSSLKQRAYKSVGQVDMTTLEATGLAEKADADAPILTHLAEMALAGAALARLLYKDKRKLIVE